MVVMKKSPLTNRKKALYSASVVGDLLSNGRNEKSPPIGRKLYIQLLYLVISYPMEGIQKSLLAERMQAFYSASLVGDIEK